MEAGIRIVELSQKLHSMFVKQSAHEKRRLLDFVVSNCLWKDGLITPTFRQPFDMLAVAVARNLPSEVASEVPSARNENWLPGMDSTHELDKFIGLRNLLILQSR
jgi:site-specific DNA recombinase